MDDHARTVLDDVDVSVWVTDEEGRVHDVNRAGCEMLGYSKRELCNMTLAQLTHPDDLRVRRAAIDGETLISRRRLRHRDGHWVLVEGRGRRSQDGKLITVVQDMSALARAEEARAEREREFETIFRFSASGKALADCDTGRFRRVNPRMCEITGYSEEELLTKSFVDITHPDDRERDWEVFRRAALDVSEGWGGERRYVRRDGKFVWVLVTGGFMRDKDGVARRSITTVTDISEQKAAEAALRQSEEQTRKLNHELRRRIEELRTLIETSPVGIAVAEDPDCRVVRVNTSLAEILGVQRDLNGLLTPDTVELPPYRFFQNGREVPPDRSPMRVCTASGQSVESWELQVVRADGSERTIINSVRPLFDEAGRIRGCISICTDITDRRAWELVLRRSEEQLRAADQRKDEFLAVLSHELRNPLAAIHNSVHVLERLRVSDERAGRALAIAGRQLRQLDKLVEDLLDVTRITRGKVQLRREPLELIELLRRTAEDHRAACTRGGVSLSVSLPSSPVWISADATRVAQIVGNLLQNAAKFTPSGGRVELCASTLDGRVVISLRDTGVGIDPALLPALFQSFMQADNTLDRSSGGLGLGLAIVKGLTELHGGSVEAKSEGVGRGAELIVRLPTIEAPTRAEQAPLPSNRATHRRVLIIEDNVDAAESLRDMLVLSGHDVCVARDGATGIALACELRPDVVLCDIGLPGMDGYAVARAFQADERLRGSTLIALTGYAAPEDRARSRQAGFEHHLSKPPALDELEQLIVAAPVLASGPSSS